jgi:hypothetical protein
MPKTSKQRRTAKEWSRILLRQRSSGLSRTEFCRREGIPLSTFDRWRPLIEREGAAAGFVELAPAPTAKRESWELEVVLPGGVQLRFRG